MYAPLYAALRPARVLFLCNGESSVRNDARLLRSLGAREILYSNDPQKALALLEDEALRQSRGGLPTRERLDVVLCDEEIQGMAAAAFLHAMSLRPALRIKPVLVLASGAKSASALAAAGVQVLERPYAEQDLRTSLQKAMSPLRRVLNAADMAALPGAGPLGGGKEAGKKRSAGSAKKAEAPMTTSDRYQQGLGLLKEKAYAPAAELFIQVLGRNEDHVGAALALAKAYRGMEDARGTRRSLLRAAAACLRNNERRQAEHIAAMLPVGMRDKIFMHEALARMEEGEYREAALGFLDAARESPGLPLHRVISRACLLSRSPDKDISRLCDAFAGLGYDSTARVIRRRLLDYEPYAASEGSSWLDRFPLLRDAVSVASHTALAWRML